ncbi:MAG: SRPBCC domain-containing protein [Gemmatimonadota bacterium]
MPNEIVVKVRSAAAPETVFKFLSDPQRAALWLGAGAVFDATPESPLLVPFPHSAAARGVVTNVTPGKGVEFTWGYEGHAELPPGSSKVRIDLEPDGVGTMIVLRHTLTAPPNVAAEHEQGWRHYATALAHAAFKTSGHVEKLIEDYHLAWNAADANARRESLARCWSPHGVFRDSMGSAAGRSDLAAYIDAARRYAPGVRIERAGAVLFTAGAALYPWRLVAEQGATLGSGYNVAQLGQDGLFDSVTGFWGS